MTETVEWTGGERREPSTVEELAATMVANNTVARRRERIITRFAISIVVVFAAAVCVYAYNAKQEADLREQRFAESSLEREAIVQALSDNSDDLICYASNSTQFFITVADILTYSIGTDVGDVTAEDADAAAEALERLDDFRQRAVAGQLDCIE